MKHEGFDLPHAFTAAVMAEALVVIAIFIGLAIAINIHGIGGLN
jgi:hypothetical protein